MFQTAGYLAERDADIVSPEFDFLVTACGHYKLTKQPYFQTFRPKGREDYQLIFVAGGAAQFRAGDALLRVEEGGGALYRPLVPQDYRYVLEDSPDIYWMHFTGRRIEEIMGEIGLTDFVIHPGVRGEYAALFERIIRELQFKLPGFSSLCGGCGQELLALMGRAHEAYRAGAPLDKRMEEVLSFLHENYQRPLRVEECAYRFHMSECAFIRGFKKRTGYTPQRYLTDIRLRQAKELLSSSALNIGEIAGLVGYENALYFSRIFRKYTGVAPREYRQSREKERRE